MGRLKWGVGEGGCRVARFVGEGNRGDSGVGCVQWGRNRWDGGEGLEREEGGSGWVRGFDWSV